MEKDKILEKLQSMTLDELDKMRDRKILELRDLLTKYHKVKDDELVARHEKRRQLIDDGCSLNKAEQLLRGDEELYKMKRIIMEYASLKKKIELEIELVSSFYWKNKL